jgi:methylenetetrahydrofolate dehydrogenase (NADP+)/methenyltetrahydrofolate cyclohydrolase
MGYQIYTYSLKDEADTPVQKIQKLNEDSTVTGIIVQKPWRNLWISTRGLEVGTGKSQFSAWWETLVTAINPAKDVDGLHPSTHDAITAGTWREQGKVLPATCKAVVELLRAAFGTENVFEHLRHNALKTIILGKSDLLGQPLFALLTSENCWVEMIGSSELNQKIEQGISLTDADVIISATGRRNLVTGEMIKPGAVVIDVGEPKGDVESASVIDKASILTPVPGGVGPMTVVSLMENAVELARVV